MDIVLLQCAYAPSVPSVVESRESGSWTHDATITPEMRRTMHPRP